MCEESKSLFVETVSLCDARLMRALSVLIRKIVHSSGVVGIATSFWVHSLAFQTPTRGLDRGRTKFTQRTGPSLSLAGNPPAKNEGAFKSNYAVVFG